MRITAFIEYCAIAAGILAIVAGKYFALHKGVELGLFLIGAGFILAGFESVYTRQASPRSSDYGWANWSGASAIILGLMEILVGAALVGCAYGEKQRPLAGLARLSHRAPWSGARRLRITGNRHRVASGHRSGKKRWRSALHLRRNATYLRRHRSANTRHRCDWFRRMGMVRSSRL